MNRGLQLGVARPIPAASDFTNPALTFPTDAIADALPLDARIRVTVEGQTRLLFELAHSVYEYTKNIEDRASYAHADRPHPELQVLCRYR